MSSENLKQMLLIPNGHFAQKMESTSFWDENFLKIIFYVFLRNYLALMLRM